MKSTIVAVCIVTYVLFTGIECALTIRDIEMNYQAQQKLLNKKLGRSPAIAYNGNKE